MSERMTDDRYDALCRDGGGHATRLVKDEGRRARASEDAKDKEIERLKADNAGLLALCREAADPGPSSRTVEACIDAALSEAHPGAALLEELTRLRAQVATIKNERPSLAPDRQRGPSSEAPGRE